MTTCNTITLITLTKQPGETRTFGMDFSNKMSRNETITSVDATVSSPTGVTFVGTSINGKIINVICSGGVNGKTYKISIIVSTDAQQVLENDGLLKILEQ